MFVWLIVALQSPLQRLLSLFWPRKCAFSIFHLDHLWYWWLRRISCSDSEGSAGSKVCLVILWTHLYLMLGLCWTSAPRAPKKFSAAVCYIHRSNSDSCRKREIMSCFLYDFLLSKLDTLPLIQADVGGGICILSICLIYGSTDVPFPLYKLMFLRFLKLSHLV